MLQAKEKTTLCDSKLSFSTNHDLCTIILTALKGLIHLFRYMTGPEDPTINTKINKLGFSRNAREAYLLDVFRPLTYYNIKLSARNRAGIGLDWFKVMQAVSAPDSKYEQGFLYAVDQ